MLFSIFWWKSTLNNWVLNSHHFSPLSKRCAALHWALQVLTSETHQVWLLAQQYSWVKWVGIKGIQRAPTIIFNQKIPCNLPSIHQDCSSQGISQPPMVGKGAVFFKSPREETCSSQLPSRYHKQTDQSCNWCPRLIPFICPFKCTHKCIHTTLGSIQKQNNDDCGTLSRYTPWLISESIAVTKANLLYHTSDGVRTLLTYSVVHLPTDFLWRITASVL